MADAEISRNSRAVIPGNRRNFSLLQPQREVIYTLAEEDPPRRGGVPPVAAGDILAGLRSVRDSGLGRRSSAPSRRAGRAKGPHSGNCAKGSPIVLLFLGIAGLRFAVCPQRRFPREGVPG